MANHSSALKRARQSDKRRIANRVIRGAMRTQIKKFRKALDGGDVEAARAELGKSISVVDRTCAKGVIHRNTASRTISRMQIAFAKMQAPQSA